MVVALQGGRLSSIKQHRRLQHKASPAGLLALHSPSTIRIALLESVPRVPWLARRAASCVPLVLALRRTHSDSEVAP